MKIDKIDFNVDYARNTSKEDWIKRHRSICSHIAENSREKYLSDVYDKLTGVKKSSRSEDKPKSE